MPSIIEPVVSIYRGLARAAVLGLLLFAAAAALSCGLLDDDASVPGNPRELILEDARSVVSLDYRALLEPGGVPGYFLGSGEDAEDFQDELEDSWDSDLGDLGMEVADVEAVFVVLVPGAGYVLVKGGFDFTDIRNALADEDLEEDTYRDFETWGSESGVVTALFEEAGIVVLGDENAVKDVLRALDRGEGFMDGEDALKKAMDAAGPGLVSIAAADCGVRNAGSGATPFLYGFDFADFGLNRCDGIAMSIAGGDEDQYKLAFGVDFRSERSAESGMDDLEEFIEDDSGIDADIDELRTDGSTVTVRLTVSEWQGYRTSQGAFSATDDHGNSLSSASRVDVNSSIRGEIEESGDEDYFAFYVSEADSITVETSAGSLSDTYITIYDPDGSRIGSDDDDGAGNASRFEFEPRSSGMYYVEVEGYSGRTGTYRLSIHGD